MAKCVLLILVACLSAFPQQTTQAPASTASDPQAVALVQRSIAVMTAGTSVSDVTLSGTVRRVAGSDDENGTATLKATEAGDSRLDLVCPSGNRSEIRNHSGTPLADSVPAGATLVPNPPLQPVGGWSGPDGVIHGFATHNVITDPTWFLPSFVLSNLNGTGRYQLSYIGQETLNGQSLLHVSAIQPSSDTTPEIAQLDQHLSQIDVYFDPVTLQPILLAFNTHPDSNDLVDIAVQVQFSDYRAVNGVQTAFHIQRYLNGGLVLDFQASNAVLNSGMAPSTFSIQ
jgi:hypothetical protein